MSSFPSLTSGVTILGDVNAEYAEILTPQALAFVARLHRQFETRRQELLGRRASRQKDLLAPRSPTIRRCSFR